VGTDKFQGDILYLPHKQRDRDGCKSLTLAARLTTAQVWPFDAATAAGDGIMQTCLDWPATPNLAARVRYRVVQPSRVWYQSRWAIAVVALLIALAALFVYTPT